MEGYEEHVNQNARADRAILRGRFGLRSPEAIEPELLPMALELVKLQDPIVYPAAIGLHAVQGALRSTEVPHV